MELGIIEVVVNCKKNPLIGVAKVVCVILAVLLLLGGLSLMGILGLWALVPIVLGVAAAIGAYLANLNSNVDYEYSLVDRELRVAKILNKEKRKAVGQYDLDKLEILAPMNSHRLDSYRNRQGLKEMDFSTRDSEKTARKPEADSGYFRIGWREDAGRYPDVCAEKGLRRLSKERR